MKHLKLSILTLTWAITCTSTSLASEEISKLSLNEVVSYLQLERHIEGGFFRRTYEAENLPRIITPDGERLSMTSIYYLLSAKSPVGHFHLNKSDIVHYFHMGEPVEYFLIHPDGHLERHIMGTDLKAGEKLQLVVPGGIWKASRILSSNKTDYSLISEAVTPGFDYEDMSLGIREELASQFPQHKTIIRELTRAEISSTQQ